MFGFDLVEPGDEIEFCFINVPINKKKKRNKRIFTDLLSCTTRLYNILRPKLVCSHGSCLDERVFMIFWWFHRYRSSVLLMTDRSFWINTKTNWVKLKLNIKCSLFYACPLVQVKWIPLQPCGALELPSNHKAGSCEVVGW